MNAYTWITTFVLYFALTHVIAQYIGTKREIGYGKSVWWSIMLTPIIGYIRTILSRPIDNK